MFSIRKSDPDHTTLCKVRNEIIAKKVYKLLLKKINKELEKHQTIVKTRVIVDGSITVSRFAPKGIVIYVITDRKEEEQKQITQRKARIKKETQSGVDIQGKWIKKSGKLYYG
ncbi:MAG: hypothetical protein ACMUEL_02880 [Flavobacteriales bacterium Tduv]